MTKKNELIEIVGGSKLEGEVRLSGAKNAALPMIVAACLGKNPTTLENVPIGLKDVEIEINLLQKLGANIVVNGNSVICDRGNLSVQVAPSELARKIRYSLLLLGLYSALGQPLVLPLPGGDKIGDRKHDLHLLGLQKLGVEIEETNESISIIPKELKGNNIDFYLPTSSGTENIMIAGAMAKGKTILRNANTRPEVQQLGLLLNKMGAKINVQSRVVEIEGVSEIPGGAYLSIMPGWDEAITYIIAAGMTNGEIEIFDFNLNQIKEDVRYLREAGLELFEWRGNVFVNGKNEKHCFDLFTAPYPGVNSDMQPLFTAFASTISGTSTITDLRFTDRFQYVEQLKLFKSDIENFGNTVIVRGGSQLKGAEVKATDIRGGMACVLSGLAAQGVTRIYNINQIERGYENFVDKLTNLGAQIKNKNH
jgi:UDP-N-acetylglucosamine 1-carboxyvinyltransferase